VRVAAVVRRDPAERRDLVRGLLEIVSEPVGRVVEVRDVVASQLPSLDPLVGAPGPSYSGVVGVFNGADALKVKPFCVPPCSPVSAVNHPNGKCLATYWSAGSPLLLAFAGWAPVKLEMIPVGEVRTVGLVTGLLLDVPGYPQRPSSRPGTVSVTPGLAALVT
jgi:hypothetical protein